MDLLTDRQNRKTAYNGRFGVMAALAPQTILCGNERLYPAGNLVEAATTPSRWDVSGNARTVRCDNGWQDTREAERAG